MRNGQLPCTVFGEKSFVTVIIPGNWHRTATPHGVFQALVSVVAVVIPGTWLPCHALEFKEKSFLQPRV